MNTGVNTDIPDAVDMCAVAPFTTTEAAVGDHNCGANRHGG